MNKRLMQFSSFFILISLFVIFVWAGSGESMDISQGLYSIEINNITEGGRLLNKLNITTGENLNFTCTAQMSNNRTLPENGSAAIITNVSFYHNLNSTYVGLNISSTYDVVNSSNFTIKVLQVNATNTSNSVNFRISNGTITYNANGGWTGVNTLSDGNFSIACAAATNNTGTFNYSSNITLTIDRIQPNFSLLNITDGTITPLQASLNGTSTATANAYFVNNTNLTLRVTLTDPFVETVRVFWTTNNTPVSLNDFRTRININNLTLNKIVQPSSSLNASVFNGSFLVGGGSDEGITNLSLFVDGTTINFMLVANDSAGNIKNFSNGGAGFNITIDGKTPNFNLSSNSLFNVTDGSTILELNGLNGTLRGSPIYLKNDSSLNFRVTITEPNVDSVKLYWTANGTVVSLSETSTHNRSGAGNTTRLNPRNLTLNRLVTQSSANNNNSVWNGSFLFGGNGSTAFTYQDNVVINFMLVVNDSAGNIKNLSNNGAGFNFTLDGLVPTISSFTLDKTRLATLNSIKATCESNDTSPVSFKIILTKPSGGKVEKGPLDGKATFTSFDTGEAGKYTIACEIEDQVKLKATKTLEFSAFFEGEDLVISEAEEVEKIADIDLSKRTDETPVEAKISGINGESKSFTLDGETRHTITFLEVNVQEVTLRFESTPVDVTLKIGETKEIDLDADGKNDLIVTLRGITDGIVDVLIKPVVQPPIQETIQTETATTSEQPTSRAGMAVLIILIIIVLAAVYFVLKKGGKGKKGEIKFTKKDLSNEFF